ncbi:hypothetical protein ACWKSP_19470 [Micromonosporaceae bacterium Da 78-11]
MTSQMTPHEAAHETPQPYLAGSDVEVQRFADAAKVHFEAADPGEPACETIDYQG